MIEKNTHISLIPSQCERRFYEPGTEGPGRHIQPCTNGVAFRSRVTGIFLCRQCAQAMWKLYKNQWKVFPFDTLDEAIENGSAFYEDDPRNVAFLKRKAR